MQSVVLSMETMMNGFERVRDFRKEKKSLKTFFLSRTMRPHFTLFDGY